MVMFGLMYAFPGAGWCITSVFLMLIVRPKLVQASANLLTFWCMSSSQMEFRVQSSANRKSLMVFVLILVFALSLLRLKTEPSRRYLIPMPISVSAKASVNMAKNIRINRVGAMTQPCFTPFDTRNVTLFYKIQFGLVAIPLPEFIVRSERPRPGYPHQFQRIHCIATKLELDDRIDVTAQKQAFITLKDHKPNFRNNPTCRLINPTKPEIGKISKQILEKINTDVKTATKLNQWKNTDEVITWFNNVENK